jgi:N-acetylglutamate synthase-like GNAT family acetyltransferase
MIAHGVIHRPEQLDGYVVENGDEWIGLVTFLIRDGQCEITSLDSLQEGQGIGTKLIGRVLEEARKNDCRRLFLITTNDNLNALGFYQKRGFESVQIQRGAVNVSRKIKPGIPLVGMNDIPLRDEIELEIRLT